jgi:CheY-like chemotaxis protein
VNLGKLERLSGTRVLVVEDFDLFGQLTRLVLEAHGAMVTEARLGREALELAAAQTFDVVLTDFVLPDMSGEAMIIGIRAASGPETPIVVVSAALDEELARAFDAGAERVFTKPVQWDELIGYLERRTKQSPARDRLARRRETPMTVLIVEDDAAMRSLLRDLLERAGHCVIELPDGSDLPSLVERERFDAVILDKEMPGPNGLDLLSFLRTRLPAVPVIFITAFGGPTIAQEAAHRGAYGYLEKPFRLATILDALATISPPDAEAKRTELH